jgi:GNAT superfamily N-acetyltransferase
MAASDRLTGIAVERATGADLERAIPDLARLRIAVFREWPYLYDGDLDYERRYLANYAKAPGSVIVVAREGGRVIGASTGLPLAHEPENVTKPFRERGLDIDSHFYFGESVLEQAYRGRGVGVRFFIEREAHARQLGGCRTLCFCAVERPADHPARPKDAVPLDAFWRRRGFEKDPNLVAHFSWKDVGESQASLKPMGFWLKRLEVPS